MGMGMGEAASSAAGARMPCWPPGVRACAPAKQGLAHELLRSLPSRLFFFFYRPSAVAFSPPSNVEQYANERAAV